MDIKQILSFITLSDTLSYVRTGELLYLSHSAVSKHISLLENELGVRLFERNTHSVKLTSEGKIFLAHARAAMGSLEVAKREIHRNPNDQAQSVLSIGYNVSIDYTGSLVGRVVTLTNRFQSLHKGIELRFLPYTTVEDLNRALNEGAIDLAINIMQRLPEDQRYEYQLIFQDSIMLLFPNNAGNEYTTEQIPLLTKIYPLAFIGNDLMVMENAVALFRKLSISPKIYLMNSFVDSLNNVAMANGIGLCPKGIYETLQIPSIIGVDTLEKECVYVYAVAENTNPLCCSFLSICADWIAEETV